MKTDTQPRKRTGRPDAETRQALDRLVIDTAKRLFIEQGYAATSVDQIASLAGVGKQTIYRRYPSKDALFQQVIDDLVHLVIAAANPPGKAVPDPLILLRRTLEEVWSTTTRPDTIALLRVLATETKRFPAIVKHVSQELSGQVHQTLSELVAAAQKSGQLRRDIDPRTFARLMTSLYSGSPTVHGLLDNPLFVSNEEKSDFFEAGWKLLLPT